MGGRVLTFTGLLTFALLALSGCTSSQNPYGDTVQVPQQQISPPEYVQQPVIDQQPSPYEPEGQIEVADLPPEVPADTYTPSQIEPQVTPNRLSGGASSGYTGNCACPDDTDSAGRRCSARSAYSRSGGYSAVCNVDKPSYAYKPYKPTYGGGTTYVKGYYRKNGTYVRPHTRRRRR
jgi:hypothetical protein